MSASVTACPDVVWPCGWSVIPRSAFGSGVASTSRGSPTVRRRCGHDDDLEQVSGSVETEDESSVWVLACVFDGLGMVDGVEDVLVGDVVLARRLVDLHERKQESRCSEACRYACDLQASRSVRPT